MGDRILLEQVQKLGRRCLAVGTGTALGWAIVVAGLTLLAGAWFDLMVELSPAIRLTVVGVSLAAAVALAACLILLAMRVANPLWIARQLDAAAETHGQIASSVDLVLDTRVRPELSAGLAHLAVDSAAKIATEAAPSKVISARPMLRAAFATLALAAIVFAIGMLLPRMALAQWLRFSDPFGDHPPYSPLTITVEPGDTKVIFGGSVDIRAAIAGGPVERVELVLESNGSKEPSIVPMFPESQDTWRTTLVNLNDPSKYFVRAQRARSVRHTVQVVTVPQIGEVRFRITPPAYSRVSPYEGPIPKEGVVGLLNTKVEVWAKSNRPLSAGKLKLTMEGTRAPAIIPMPPISENANEAAVEFLVAANGKLEFQLIDTNGELSTETFTAAITKLPDERPFVRIIEPREISFATPNAQLPVVISAEDDYGISRLQLFRSLNGSRPIAIDLPIPQQAPRRFEETTLLPLSSYGLRAGDEIQLFARVEDNDPQGAKGSESAIVMIRIIAQEEYERMVLTQQGMETLAAKYQQAERRMESVMEEIAKAEQELAKSKPNSPASEQAKKQLEQLQKKLQEESDALKQLAKQTLPFDLDKELSKELEKLAEQLAQAAKQCESMAKNEGGQNKPGAPRTTEELKKEIEELKKMLAQKREDFDKNAGKPVKDMAKVFPLMQDESRFVQICKRQRDLAIRMEPLKGHDKEDNPQLRARMRDLENEQRQLREDLKELLDDIESHANQLPEDPDFDDLRETALKFANDVRSCGALESQADAEGALAEFAGTRAHESAKRAADLLEEFLKKCEKGEMAGKCNGCLKFQPQMKQQMSDCMNQMLANAGLRSGKGKQSGNEQSMGMGSGDGYSAQQNTTNNVGLYGNLPTMTSAEKSGSGNRPSANGPGNSNSPTSRRFRENVVQSNGKANSVGTSESQVPVPYRKRVAEYFQRVTDEIGGKK